MLRVIHEHSSTPFALRMPSLFIVEPSVKSARRALSMKGRVLSIQMNPSELVDSAKYLMMKRNIEDYGSRGDSGNESGISRAEL